MSKDRRKLLHIHSSVNDKQPTPSSIEFGELAVNNASGNAFISTKNVNEEVVRFSEDATIVNWIDDKEVFPNNGDVNLNGDGTSSIDIHLNQQPSSKSPGSSAITNSSFSIDTSAFALKSEVNGVLEDSKVTTTTATTEDNAYSSVTFTQSGKTIGKIDIPSLVPVYSTITDNELVTSSALNDLNAKKLDESAYTEAISTLISTASYDSTTKKIVFKNKSGVTQSEIDATDFIKDGMVDTVKIENNNLVITFNTDAGKEDISISLTSIFNPNNYFTKTEVESYLSTKVDKVTGKGLSTNDYTDDEKTKLAVIESGAEVNVQSDWEVSNVNSDAFIKNKPNLSIVARTGSYDDLNDKPIIPAAQVQSDWNASSGVAQILNKPNLAAVATSGSYNDLSNKPTIPAAQVQSDWNATTGMGVILNKPTDLELQANWTQTNTSAKDYIKNKPYFSGYYIATGDTQVSDRQYVGVQKPSDKPDSTYPYLYYYNGSSWRLVDQYISPDPNLYYIASTDLGYYNDGTTGYYYPEGYVAYVDSGGSTQHIDYIYTNYIKHSHTTQNPVEPGSADTYNYKAVMRKIKTLAQNGTHGIPKLEGYHYVFSFTESNKSYIDSNALLFDKKASLQNSTDFVSNVNGNLTNATKHNTGFFVYNNTGSTSSSTTDWTLIEVYQGPTNNRSNDPNYPIDHDGTKEKWDSRIWVERFLGAQLYPLIKANESHNFDYGWSDFHDSSFYITGDGGWISGYVASPKEPVEGSNTAKLWILNLSGQISSVRYNVKNVVRFNFKNVEVGQKNKYAEMNYTATTPSVSALDGRIDMYDVTFDYNNYSYTFESLNKDTLSVVNLTQSEYDSMQQAGEINANTLYVIVG